MNNIFTKHIKKIKSKSKKSHVIISGTGRCGTTFLVQLFTALGLDTGFETPYDNIFHFSKAGMEKDIRANDAPYIIKNPWLCDYIEEVLSLEHIKIDYAIIPIRDLYSASESRRVVSKEYSKNNFDTNDIPGGLWHTDIPEMQEVILAKQLYKLIYFLTVYDVPMVFLYFPKLAKEPTYLYNKLKIILDLPNKNRFNKIFSEISKPEIIHDFQDNNTKKKSNFMQSNPNYLK